MSAREQHLGTMIGQGAHVYNIDSCIADLIKRSQATASIFSKVDPCIRYNLFKTYCMSLYGCVLWDFSSDHVKDVYTAWRKSIRSLLRLPWRAHSKLLPVICRDMPVDAQIHSRFLNFFRSIYLSDNTILRTCCKLVLNGSMSTVCNSINFICNKYHLCKFNIHHFMPRDLQTSRTHTISNSLSLKEKF